MMFALLVDEEVDVAGALVDSVAFALADEEALFAGEDLAEAADVAEDVALAQLGSGLGRTLSLLVSSDLALIPVLVLLLALGLGLVDVAGVVEVSLGLGLPLALALALALAEALALELALIMLLLWLPLGDVAGAVVAPVVLLGELFLVSATDGCVDGDEQGLGVGCTATPGTLGDGSAAAEGVGVVPWPSVEPAPPEVLLLVKA
jgi:hypothetical protein